MIVVFLARRPEKKENHTLLGTSAEPVHHANNQILLITDIFVCLRTVYVVRILCVNTVRE